MKGGFAVDWNKLKAEYIAGGTSYRKLAKKYDIPLATLARRAKDENWVSNKEQIDDNVSTTVTSAVTQNLTENALKLSEATCGLIRQFALDVATGAIDKEKAETYRIAADALKKFKEVEGIKSRKDAEEQEARILNLRRQAEKDSTGKDKQVVVVLGDDVKEFLE